MSRMPRKPPTVRMVPYCPYCRGGGMCGESWCVCRVARPFPSEGEAGRRLLAGGAYDAPLSEYGKSLPQRESWRWP